MPRKPLLFFVVILACAALAIAAHAALPAEVDADRLDGFLVQEAGFPIVAVSYFVLLYAHCGLVIDVNRRNMRQGRIRNGLLLAFAFALLYMIECNHDLDHGFPPPRPHGDNGQRER